MGDYITLGVRTLTVPQFRKKSTETGETQVIETGDDYAFVLASRIYHREPVALDGWPCFERPPGWIQRRAEVDNQQEYRDCDLCGQTLHRNKFEGNNASCKPCAEKRNRRRHIDVLIAAWNGRYKAE